MTPRIPKISIVISVYNKASFLNECIESVINQDLTDFEVICIDAGSTDRSLTILQEYASKDDRIAVYNTPYTEIPSVTKNYGIDRSKGEYVFNLDADDYLSPNTLQKMYSKAIQTNADAVIPDLQIVKDKSKNIQSRKIGLNYDRNAILTGNEAVTESLDWTIHAFALWKGDLIRRLRLEEFGTYSDEYSARLLFFNCKKITFSEGSYNYRIHT